MHSMRAEGIQPLSLGSHDGEISVSGSQGLIPKDKGLCRVVLRVQWGASGTEAILDFLKSPSPCPALLQHIKCVDTSEEMQALAALY